MPGHIKFLAFLLMIAMTGIVSYANSDAIYSFYLRTWYVSVKKMTSSQAVSQAELLKREYRKMEDAEKRMSAKEAVREEYEDEALKYMDTMSRVFRPELNDRYSAANREFGCYAGLFYLDRGNVLKGAGMILAAVQSPPSRDEAVPFMRAIRALYDAKMYSDVVSELALHKYPHTAETLFLRGSSLFHLKEYNDAIVSLQQAAAAGSKAEDIDIETALCLRELKRYADALPHAERALADNPKDREARELVVSLLTTLGRIKEAEKISRAR